MSPAHLRALSEAIGPGWPYLAIPTVIVLAIIAFSIPAKVENDRRATACAKMGGEWVTLRETRERLCIYR